MIETNDKIGFVPYFSWDRNVTEQQIKGKLSTLKGLERDKLIAWIRREASFQDVWNYITPQEAIDCLPLI